jgi:zinc D-Ala-D-Ala carboxypeptidase
MKYTKNFSEYEFTRSQIAARHNIDNSIKDEKTRNNLIWLAKTFLQPLRDYASEKKGEDCPINISSGFRSLMVNRRLGSSDFSDHRADRDNAAVDFTIAKYTLPDAFDLIIEAKEKGIIPQWNQLVYEFDSWIHLGVSRFNPKGEILQINRNGKKLINKAPR